MLAALIIVFREVLEAGLVVGIVLAATHGIRDSRAWIAGGLAAGLLGSAVVAGFTDVIASALSGMGQELFNATVLSIAVVMLAWHNVWMAKHGREISREMRAVGEDVSQARKPISALALVVGLAVLREGSEVALFLYGAAIAGGSSALAMLGGGALGLLAGAAVSAITYAGLLRIPHRLLFGATSLLITFLAAGMAAQAVFFLQQAGAVTMLGDTAWDSSTVLAQDSVAGTLLHVLLGYADQPSWLQVVAYGAVIVVITAATRLIRGKASAGTPATPRPAGT